MQFCLFFCFCLLDISFPALRWWWWWWCEFPKANRSPLFCPFFDYVMFEASSIAKWSTPSFDWWLAPQYVCLYVYVCSVHKRRPYFSSSHRERERETQTPTSPWEQCLTGRAFLFHTPRVAHGGADTGLQLASGARTCGKDTDPGPGLTLRMMKVRLNVMLPWAPFFWLTDVLC